MKVKTRFAPSPTGYLHIGSARTALYSWLYAKKKNGKFILRIEDTDLDRFYKNSVENIINSLHWLKLNWDEGPYFQTDRFNYYNEIIKKMLYKGFAYKCYCSKERLNFIKKMQILKGEKNKYDGYCRNYKNQIDNIPFVIRFRNPNVGSVIFNDLIRGPIEFKNKELSDFIIRRSDGSPTYNFCVAVDDYSMNITHVIRGEEHINNTPKQINILNALDVSVPKYAHLSMIIEDDGKKFSKRHGAISIMKFKEDGFLPESILNHLLRLGWSYGNSEIFSIEKMKKLFSLNSVNRSPSKFNIKKLLWLNKYYINNLPKEYVSKNLLWHIKNKNIKIENGPKLENIIKLFGKRFNTLKEISENCLYLYEDITNLEQIFDRKYLKTIKKKLFLSFYKKIEKLKTWDLNSINTMIKKTIKEEKAELVQLSKPLRIAITGSMSSPPLDSIIYNIGKSNFLIRMNKLLNFFDKYQL